MVTPYPSVPLMAPDVLVYPSVHLMAPDVLVYLIEFREKKGPRIGLWLPLVTTPIVLPPAFT